MQINGTSIDKYYGWHRDSGLKGLFLLLYLASCACSVIHSTHSWAFTSSSSSSVLLHELHTSQFPKHPNILSIYHELALQFNNSFIPKQFWVDKSKDFQIPVLTKGCIFWFCSKDLLSSWIKTFLLIYVLKSWLLILRIWSLVLDYQAKDNANSTSTLPKAQKNVSMKSSFLILN